MEDVGDLVANAMLCVSCKHIKDDRAIETMKCWIDRFVDYFIYKDERKAALVKLMFSNDCHVTHYYGLIASYNGVYSGVYNLGAFIFAGDVELVEYINGLQKEVGNRDCSISQELRNTISWIEKLFEGWKAINTNDDRNTALREEYNNFLSYVRKKAVGNFFDRFRENSDKVVGAVRYLVEKGFANDSFLRSLQQEQEKLKTQREGKVRMGVALELETEEEGVKGRITDNAWQNFVSNVNDDNQSQSLGASVGDI